MKIKIMNRIRKLSLFLRSVSIGIMLTFLPVNATWADSFVSAGAPALAVELLSGQDLMLQRSVEARQDIALRADIYGSVLAICKYLFKEKLPLKFLSPNIENELGYVVSGLERGRVTSFEHFESVEQNPGVFVSAPEFLSEEDVIVIPYSGGGRDVLIYAAQKNNPKFARLGGEEERLSEEYVIKIHRLERTGVNKPYIRGKKVEDIAASEEVSRLIRSLKEKDISATVNNKRLEFLSDNPASLLDFIKRFTVLRENEDILFVLRERLAVESGRPLEGALISEMVKGLYNGIFDQEEYLKTYSEEKPLRVSIFRGGRGATGITRFLSNMPNVAVDVILGGTDDGRSWYIAAQDFNATGLPDVGKSLLDLGKDIDVIDFLGARLKGDKAELVDGVEEFMDVMEEVAKGKTGKIENKLADYMDGTEILAEKIKESFTEQGLGMVADKGKRNSIILLCDELADTSKVYRRRAKAISGISSLLQDIIDKAESEKEETYMRFLKKQVDTVFNFNKMSGLYFYLSQMAPEKVSKLFLYLRKFMEVFPNVKKHDDPEKYTDFTLHNIPMRSVFLLGAAWYYDGDWQKAVDELFDIVDVPEKNKILFATKERKHLMGMLEDGTVYFTETGINEHPKSSKMLGLWLVDRKFDMKGFAEYLEARGIMIKNITVDEKSVQDEGLRREIIENTMKVDPEFAVRTAEIISEMSITGKYSKEKCIANPKAIKAIEKADAIFYSVTTLESNMGSSLVVEGVKKAIERNVEAVKIDFVNPTVENDPVLENAGQGINAVDIMERIYRYVSGHQGYCVPRHTWEGVSHFMDYVVGSPDIYEKLDMRKKYIPFDPVTTEDSVYGRIGAVGMDLELKKAVPKQRKDYSGYNEEYGFYSPQLTGETIISLTALKGSGFKLSSTVGLEFLSPDEKENPQKETMNRFRNVIREVVRDGKKIAWVSDLEDTMNKSGIRVSEEALDVIIEILRQGIPFIVISGSSRKKIDRSFTEYLLKKVSSDEKNILNNLIISSNSGNEAYQYDIDKDKFVLFNAVDMKKEIGAEKYDLAIKIIKDVMENWVDADGRNFKKILEVIMGIRFSTDDSWRRFKGGCLEERSPEGGDEQITQIALRFLGKGAVRSQKEEFKKNGGDEFREQFAKHLREVFLKNEIPLSVTVTQLSTIDITLKDFDKSRGMEIISDRMKLKGYYIIYSGDGFSPGHNDESALRVANIIFNLGKYFNPVRSCHYRAKGHVFQLPDTKEKGFVDLIHAFIGEIKDINEEKSGSIGFLMKTMGIVSDFRQRFIFETDRFGNSIGWSIPDGLKKNVLDLFFRVEEAIFNTKAKEHEIAQEVNREIPRAEKEIRDFKMNNIISELIILARRAKDRGEDLVVALDTGWIPGNAEGDLQQLAISALINDIESLGGGLKGIGFKNLKIVLKDRKKDLKEWSCEIMDSLDEKNDFSNVVIMGSKGVKTFFDSEILAGVDNEKRAFIAEIDPSELDAAYEEYGERESEQILIDVLSMMAVAINLAVGGRNAPDIPMIVKDSYDSVKRTVVLLPKARMMGYGDLVEFYKAERNALKTAA